MANIQIIPLKLIVADPEQPRQEFDTNELKRLERSIASQGILTPLALEKMADGKYLLVDGERRFRASNNLDLKEVPAIVYEPMNEKERIMTRFHLQEQHSGWSSFDKARAIATMQQSTNMSVKEIADLLGLTNNTVSDYLLLLSLSKRTIQAASKRKLPYEYLAEIARVKKSVEEVTLRTALEDSLIKKVEDGVISKSADIRKYRFAINEKGEVAVRKIIATPMMSPDGAMQFADLENKQKQKILIYTARTLANQLIRHKTSGQRSTMTTDEMGTLHHLAEVLANYLE